MYDEEREEEVEVEVEVVREVDSIRAKSMQFDTRAKRCSGRLLIGHDWCYCASMTPTMMFLWCAPPTMMIKWSNEFDRKQFAADNYLPRESI